MIIHFWSYLRSFRVKDGTNKRSYSNNLNDDVTSILLLITAVNYYDLKIKQVIENERNSKRAKKQIDDKLFKIFCSFEMVG